VKDEKIACCRIYPGLGIARVGDSPEGYFIGPESPGHAASPAGGFKDKTGRIKRQAARFRIYAYNAAGEVLKEITSADADITWTVHLVNRKAEFEMFLGRFWAEQYPQFSKIDSARPPLRNQEVTGAARAALVIDPGPRSICGEHQSGRRFDGGGIGPLPYTVYTAENKNCLAGHRSGYLGIPWDPTATDLPPKGCTWTPGRLIEPVAMSPRVEVPLGELRTDARGRLLILGGHGLAASIIPHNEIGYLNADSYFANNDYWYDDTSDGPVTAEVQLKDGTRVPVVDKAWVLVTPPKFAPSAKMLTTLYQTAMEAWEDKIGVSGEAPGKVSFKDDIYPVLERMELLQWVNKTAYRGHGSGKGGAFVDQDLFRLLRDPSDDPDAAHARQHVFSRLRTPGLDATSDAANAQSSYTLMPQLGGDGGAPQAYDPSQPQPPGGAYLSWLTLSPRQYRDFERWSMGDFEDDWPKRGEGQSPTLDELPIGEQPAALDLAALEPCVGAPFYPGIEMTYISRYPETWSGPCRVAQTLEPGDITRHMALPWQSDFSQCRIHWWPAQRPDDVVTEAEFLRVIEGYDRKTDGPLAQALATRELWSRGLDQSPPAINNAMTTSWKELGFVVGRSGPGRQTALVETERSPYAGTSERDYFYYLMNIDSYPSFLPRAYRYVKESLATAWDNQFQTDPDERWRFFDYSEEAFDARLDQIYNNFVNDANNDATDNASLRKKTREQVIYGLLQMAPFNQLDGAWLRGVTPAGPMSQVHAILFNIYMDELGDAVAAHHHCNVYTDLLKSVGIYLPELSARDYADNPELLDSAFTEPVFILAISQFSSEFLPEILGMTLLLEWEAVSLMPTVDELKSFGIDPLYYVLHVGIDNAAAGHGALAKRAVKLFLDEVRQREGDAAMQAAWKRIWTGYLAFGTLGTLGDDMASALAQPPSLADRMQAMITEKAAYASLNHRSKQLGANLINDWFLDPSGFLDELVRSGIVVPGKPEISPIFKLTGFQGPMFHVFNEAELALWSQWILSLPAQAPTPKYSLHKAMIHLITTLRQRQQGTPGHHVTLKGPDPRDATRIVTLTIDAWFNLDLGSDEANATALMAALAHDENGWIVRGDAAQSPLVTDILGGNGAMATALQAIAPDSGGRTFKNVLVEWIAEGCPIVPQSKVKPSAKRRRPVLGMGRVH
jgi:hypothetical protein